MADNINVIESTVTGKAIAADDISGVLHQRVKIVIGADGVSNGDVSSTNPIPIEGTVTSNIGTTNGLALDSSLTTLSGKDFATQTTLVAVKAKTDNIPALGQALAASSVPVVLTSAQLTTLTPPSSVSVLNFPNDNSLTDTQLRASAVPVSVSGVATSSLQTTANTSLSSIDSKLTSPITVSGTVIASNPSVGTSSSAIPTSSTLMGASDGTNLKPLLVDSNGLLKVNEGSSAYDYNATNLTAGSTYTTAWFDTNLSGSGGVVYSQCDQATTYTYEYSNDQTTVFQPDTGSIPAGLKFQESQYIPARYWRFKLTNNGVVTTTTLTIMAQANKSPEIDSVKLTDKNATDFYFTTKGASQTNAIPTQDLKDSGRNMVNLYMPNHIITTATDTLIALTGYKSGVAVAATTTPAVVSTGKTYRITAISISYIGVIAEGNAHFTLRANTAGVAAITSPSVIEFSSGNNSRGTAGEVYTHSVAIPDGMEFAAGTGLGVSLQGFSATAAAAAVGYAKISIIGYEY